MAGVVMAIVAWVAGVALLVLWPRLPSAAWLWALGGLGLGLVCLWAILALVADHRPIGSVGAAVWARQHAQRCRFRRRTVLMPVLLLVAAACLAHSTSGLRSLQRLEARLPHALEGVPLVLVGVVQDLPRRTPQGVQFAFRVESAHQLSGAVVTGVPPRIWLGWWMDGHIDVLLAAAVPEPRPGERWQLPAVLKRPHGLFNPGAFDAERWFLEQDLGASGSVSSGHRGLARRLDTASSAWPDTARGRAALRDRIDAHVRDDALAGLVAGLTIGDQSSVDAADWQLFRAAGVAHALSISGAHITIFAALTAPLVAWLWRRWPRACLLCPAPWAGVWVGWCLALAYALLAGWGLPAQRTVWMLAVVGLARTLSLNWPAMAVWIVAAAPIVVLDPWAVWQAGFWLSFAAVGLLLLAGDRMLPPAHWGETVSITATRPPGTASAAAGLPRQAMGAWPQLAWRSIRTQVITAVGLAPLAAACFGELSVVGVLGNLVALPWITLLLTPLCMLGILWPPIWALLPWVVDPLRFTMAALVSLPGAVVSVPGSGPWALAGALLGAALALMRLPLGLRLSGLALMVPLLLPPPQRPPPGRFEMWALDVGQGSAVLVRTRHHALLLDAGPAWGEGRDAGDRVVLPVLRHLGVRGLDELVVTHRDLDHAGGAASVLKGLPVARLRSSLDPSHPLLKSAVPHEPCRRGQSWRWDGVGFEVLHPFGDEGPRLKPNALSCVLRIEDAGGRSLLLTGDIEREQEQALVRAPAVPPLRADGLVVPHHGSRTSSTEPFLRAVQPQWALAQAGYRNRYGHPAPPVVARYAALGIPLWSSPGCGALRWRGEELQCWRTVQPRHWHEHMPLSMPLSMPPTTPFSVP